MLDPESASTPAQTLFVTRVVVASLLFGLVSFAAVVLMTMPERDSDGDLMLVVAGVGVVIGVAGSLAAGRLVPAYYRRRGLGDEGLLAQAFFNTNLLRAAALEGGGFLCLIATMISGQPLGFAGAAVCALLLALWFPTRGAWDRFRAAVGSGGEATSEPR